MTEQTVETFEETLKNESSQKRKRKKDDTKPRVSRKQSVKSPVVDLVREFVEAQQKAGELLKQRQKIDTELNNLTERITQLKEQILKHINEGGNS